MSRVAARRFRAVAGGALRIAMYVVLASAAMVAAFHFFDLPPFLERRLLAELEARGAVARTGGIRLDLPDGLVARNVRLYAGPAAQPIAAARRLALRLRRPERPGGGWLSGVAVRGLALRMDAAPNADLPAWSAAPSVFEDMDADLEFAPEGLRVRRLEARFLGARWIADGRIAARAPGERTAARLPEDWPARLRAAARRIAQVARALDDLEMRAEPVVLVRFAADPDRPEQTEVALSASGGAGRCRGLIVEGWNIGAELREGRWALQEAEMRFARGRLSASGELQVETDEIALHIEGDMPLRDWLCLPLPPEITRRMDRLDIRADRVRIELATPGFTPRAEWGKRLEGRLEVERGEAAGVPFERFAARARLEGARLRLDEIEAVIGEGRGRGPARGVFEVDVDTGRFEGSVGSEFDLTVLMPLYTARQAFTAGAVVFRGAPPRVRAEISGSFERGVEPRIRGRIEAEDFVFCGTGIRRAAGEFLVENDTLRVWDASVERPEGRLTGRFAQNFKTDEADFEGESTLHPHALARLVAPFLHRLLQQFRFEGPVRIVGGGHATGEGRHDHDFRLSIEGEKMGLRWILVERAAFEVEARRDRVWIRNIRGEWHGGRGEGEMEIELKPGREPPRYRVRGKLEGAELAGLVRDLTDSDASAYSGRLYVEGEMAGAIGEGQGRGAVGAGRVAVRDGKLLQIPLFGALSRGLTRIYPGLGFAAQNEFTADLKLAEGRFHTDNAMLFGDTISLRARGYYDIENRIEMVAQVRPLRAGPIAAALRFITFPLTRLFEFDVTGTPQQPRWEPRNLPKELF